MKRLGIRQSGFTLVEMLMVMSLLALAAAISLPFARTSLEERRFEGKVKELADYLRDAQATASAKGEDVAVIYDVKSRQFTSTGNAKPIPMPDDISLSLLSVSDHVKPEGAGYVFFAVGGNSGGHLSLERGKVSRSITLNWLTGTVSSRLESDAP